MTTTLSPSPKLQFFGTDGTPLVGGKLYSYTAGTSTPLATYTDSTGSTANPNPTILDSRGEANVWLSSNVYKLVLKTSTDTLLWTVDSITGVADLTTLAASGGSNLIGFIQTGGDAITVQAKLRQVLSVKDFGAVGDGATDDSVAIQDALNLASGRSVYFPAGTYRCVSLVMKTKTTLLGDGINQSILKLTTAASAASTLLRNDTQSGTVDVYYDTDLAFSGITFDGNSNATRTVELLSILKAHHVQFTNCAVQNNTYIGLAIGASKDVIVSRCYFTNNGRPSPSTTSAPAFWTGTSALGTPYDVRVENCYFYENEWSAAYFMPTRGSFSNNICLNNGESTVFANSTGSYLRFENNQITGATRSNISGSGIECGASHVVISGNLIDSCASDGISMTDAQNVTVANNQIFNNGQDTAYYSYANGVSVISTAASPSQPDHIEISGNRIGDRQGTKTQYAAVGLGVSGSGAAITRLAIHNNDFTEQKTATYYNFTTSTLGAGSYTSNNYDKDAALQPPFRYKTFTLNGSAGAQAITGVGFRPRSIKITAVLSSTTQAYTSVGIHDGTSGSTICSSVDASGRRGQSSTGVISILDSAGASVATANLTSFDVDGFTINVLVGSTSCVCVAECYA